MEKGSILRVINPVFIDNTELVEAYIIRSQTEWFAMARDAKEKLGQDWSTPPEMRYHEGGMEMWFPWKTPEEMWNAEVKICAVAVSMMMDAGASAANAPDEGKMPCHSILIYRNVPWNYTLDDLMQVPATTGPSN